jgi:segregation and condensation protein B
LRPIDEVTIIVTDPSLEIDRSESAAVEAVLITATDPVPPNLLAELLEVSTERIAAICAALAAEYERDERGFEIVRVAGGFRFQSHPAYAGHVERFILDDAPQRLSPAALETLAIIAYKQPISRAQIAQIRGVNADGVVRMLTERGYIGPIGRDDGPGLAILFGTTSLFLERLGLDRIEELPPLEAFVPEVGIVEGLERLLRPEQGS